MIEKDRGAFAPRLCEGVPWLIAGRICRKRAHLLEKSVSRCDNEDGAGNGGRVHAASTYRGANVPPLTNAELVQLQIWVIAFENLLTVLLAGSSTSQLDLAREMADYISPRPGFTPHHLTLRAATRMLNLVEREGRLNTLDFAEQSVHNPPDAKPLV